jgi:hypothetical protein
MGGMTTTASIAELQQAGVILQAREAVAIAQQLIRSFNEYDQTFRVAPPFGPPTAATVFLHADGSVSCAGCGTTPAISEIAIFLDTLLPSGSPRVPGGLRYTIARGLLEVDVAPFDSLDEFAQALSRHESGACDDVIRGLLQRTESACAASLSRADRRKSRATSADLRRALRDADAQLYAQQAADAVAVAAPPLRVRTVPAIAACLGSGLMLIAAGEFMHGRQTARPVAAAVVAPAAVGTSGTSPGTSVAPASAPSAASTRPANATRVRRVPAVRNGSEGRDRSVVKRATQTSASAVQPAKTRRSSSGVLDRLRLRWLRRAFSIRVDEL